MELTETVRLELLKLLVQLVWSDDGRDEREIEYVRQVARRIGASPATTAAMERWLNDHEALPPPDLSVLKPHNASILGAARALAQVDGNVDAQERWMITELEDLLSG